ncbi:MAG: endolytic transglycosylase MltG [Lachnospiraceae bacterium]|nr:endolytic transglycosylase MltG [Lachnospiraceae bacterium]
MNIKQVIGAVLGTILKVVVAVLVIYYVYKGATMAYDYGYRIFAEPAMAEKGEGRDITVEITMGKSVLQIGELLEQKGLIRDSMLFYIQNLLSEYSGKLAPGTYTLNTSMTAREMMAVMSVKDEESGGSENEGGSLAPPADEGSDSPGAEDDMDGDDDFEGDEEDGAGSEE